MVTEVATRHAEATHAAVRGQRSDCLLGGEVPRELFGKAYATGGAFTIFQPGEAWIHTKDVTCNALSDPSRGSLQADRADEVLRHFSSRGVDIASRASVAVSCRGDEGSGRARRRRPGKCAPPDLISTM